MFAELGNITLFCAGERWAELRRPGLLADIGQRLDRLQSALGDREWLAGRFSIADIAMVTVLREVRDSGLLDSRPGLAAYLRRGTARPAFAAALHAQLADLQPEPAMA